MPTDVAAYYFPGYHVDPMTSRLHGEGWTEWELVAAARPRFRGHEQPRRSTWGAFDEADPRWGLRQAQLAAEHGVNVFIVDWYWYDNADFLNGALDRGLLPWGEALPVRLALMWANHDWLDIHPAGAASPPDLLFRGGVDAATFDRLADVVIERYLLHPRYYRIDGAAYFSLYEPQTFVDGLGSRSDAARALDRFRERARAAGAGDVHLNLVIADRPVLPNERQLADSTAMIRDLGADSTTSYVWIHHHDPALDGFPRGSYQRAFQANREAWARFQSHQAVPYFPNVTVGWDSSPRTIQTDRYEHRGYPWMATLDGAGPAAFGEALQAAHEFVEGRAGHPLITINAWNEWTEGSYLLPDERHGLGFLEACRDVGRRSRVGSA